MKISRELLKAKDFEVPVVFIIPEKYSGCAIIVHGYGDCKETLLGFSEKISEKGFLTCTIDLRGHGENKKPLDKSAILDINFVVDYCKKYGKVAIVGHSLGGRLGLLSNADYKIGIAPAICTGFDEETRSRLKNNFEKRVKANTNEDFLEIFYKLQNWREENETAKTYILYAQDDIPSIKENCISLKKTEVCQIKEANHSDIYFYDETVDSIVSKLEQWFSGK
ncbi:alpha/beta fold hydrolase [bacterium]|nr:alpha/beta fold hydrolase [bacterium]